MTESTKYRIFAFDTPFNRQISVVYGHHYICEAHLIEKLNVREMLHYKVSLHVREQQLQHKYYSKRLKQLHTVIFQTSILNQVSNVPIVDHIRYGQAIDTDKDQNQANDQNMIPEKLKRQAIEYAENLYKIEADEINPGPITLAMERLGRKSRENEC